MLATESPARAHVDHGDQAFAHSLGEFGLGNGFQGIQRQQISFDQTAHFGEIILRRPSQDDQQRQHVFAGDGVKNVPVLFARGDQSGPPQVLEVLRGVGDREPGEGGEGFDAAFLLGKEFQQFQTVAVGQGLPDIGQAGEKLPFEGLRFHAPRTMHSYIQLVN